MQQINLAIIFESEGKTSITIRNFLEISGVFLGLLLLVSFASWWRLLNKHAEVTEASKQKIAKEAEIAKIKATKASEESEASLKIKLEKITKERNRKLQLLTLLANRDLGNTRGFSSYMQGLAKEKVSGVAISAFSIDGSGKLELEGSALKNELVPVLLQSIGTTKAFRDVNFKHLQISRTNKSDFFDFKLRTEQASGNRK